MDRELFTVTALELGTGKKIGEKTEFLKSLCLFCYLRKTTKGTCIIIEVIEMRKQS